MPVRIAFLALLGALVAAPCVAAVVRFEPVDADYLTGSLTWNAGQGGIAWMAGAPTEDPGGPQLPQGPDATLQDGQYALNERHLAATGKRLYPAAVDTFTAAKLPTTLFLNVTRLVQVDLFVTNSVCEFNDPKRPKLDVEVYAGEELFAGGIWSSQQFLAFLPANPANHCYLPFRMEPTMEVLEAGTVLTIKVVHTYQGTGFRYGLKGDHASVIRLASYPAEDVPYRVPYLLKGTNGAATTPNAAAMLLPFALAPIGRRRPGVAVASMVALLALAGCAGGPGTPEATKGTDGSAQEELLRGGPDGLANATHGSLLGFVYDDLELPVVAAHVTLTGSSYATDSDARGKFRFTSLPVGAYDLRVDHAEYKPVFKRITIAPQAVTRLDVLVVPKVDRPADERPHKHDDWEGKPSKVLLDETFDTGANHFLLPSPMTVLPGARRLEFTVSWQTPWLDRVLLLFQANNEGIIPFAGKNRTETYYYGSGETIRIPLAKEMTDSGHQRLSRWGYFYILRSASTGYTLDRVDHASEPEATYHVRIEIVKGVVSHEAPHRDFWGANLTQPVVALQKQDRFENTYGASGPFLPNYTWLPDALVPPETVWLDVRLEQTRAMSVGTQTWTMVYQPANAVLDNPDNSGGDLELYSRCPANEAKPNLKLRALTKGSDNVWTSRIGLSSDESDPYYAKRSNWCFWVVPSDPYLHYVDLEMNNYYPVELKLSVTAHRDTVPS